MHYNRDSRFNPIENFWTQVLPSMGIL
jgi:hypothetical protein